VFNLANVFEEIVDRFDDSPLTEQDFVSHIHEFVLHVFLQLGNEMNTAAVEFLEQRSRKIAFVSENLAEHMLSKLRNDRPISVVNIAGGEAESDDFTSVVDGNVQFEPEKPAS